MTKRKQGFPFPGGCARIAILSRSIAVPPGISPELLGRHFNRKHGAGAYYGQG